MSQVIDLNERRNRKNLPPATVKRDVPPGRPRNIDLRSREYLLPAEVARLVEQAGKVGRHRHRDKCMMLTAYRHGLRVSELVNLFWNQIDFRNAQMHVHRIKSGTPAVHPIKGDELRLLRKLKDRYESAFVFTSERGLPLSRSTIANVMSRAGRNAELGFPVHPHMLRHACGYYLANRGVDTRTIQAYLGHRSIQHTVRYTELAPGRFNNLWD